MTCTAKKANGELCGAPATTLTVIDLGFVVVVALCEAHTDELQRRANEFPKADDTWLKTLLERPRGLFG